MPVMRITMLHMPQMRNHRIAPILIMMLCYDAGDAYDYDAYEYDASGYVAYDAYDAS